MALDRPATVLIIEDEGIISLALERIVQSLGCEVLGPVATSAEAVALAAGRPPDLVVSDVALGEGDSGLVAVRAIRAARPVPVVFITAYPEALATERDLGDAVIVAKPTDPDTVRNAVAGLLQRL